MMNINKITMNKNYLWIALAVVFFVITAALLFNNQPESNVASEQNNATMPNEQKTEPTVEGGAMLEKVDDKMTNKDQTQSNDLWAGFGSYQNYSPELVKSEQQAGRTVVLFFHASWCPYCKEADANFQANLDKIPQGVTVLKTDYDSNTDLKKKYGVTYQHTFVQIDSQGNLVSKWSGGDIDNLIKYLK